MKKLILSFLLSTVFLLLKGQDKETIPDPEFINHVFLLTKENKYQDLEKKDAEVVTKSKVIGIGGAKQLYIIDGSKSSVVIPAGEMMFVIGTGGGGFGMDPSSIISLHKFESRKNKREATAAAYGGKSKSNENNQISLNFKKLKEGVFGIVPEKPLEKGEYAFVNRSTMQGGGMSMKMGAFAFSIE